MDDTAGVQADSKTVTAIVIPADKDEPIWSLEVLPHYRNLQELVSGLIEFISLPHGASFMGNDEAKLYGLPPNIRATGLLYVLRPEFIGQDFLAGDMVLLGAPDADGDTTSVPELFVKLLVEP